MENIERYRVSIGTISSTEELDGMILKDSVTYAVPGAYYSVAVKTAKTNYLQPVDKAAAKIPIGIESKEVTLGASATVSGKVNASTYAVVAAGSTVPESMTKDAPNTAYYVENNLYVTVYVNSVSSAYTIGKIRRMPRGS